MKRKDAYSIPEYCELHDISRAHLYNLWRANKGPRRMKFGARTLISREAAEDHRRECEEWASSEREAV